jgi:hypothetical protein
MKAVRHLALVSLAVWIGCTGSQALQQLPRDELIVVLQDRLAVVRAAGADGLESFPRDLDVTPLVGLTEAELIEALGEPTMCGMPLRYCSTSEDSTVIGYSFYRLPAGAGVRGRGTVLILWLDESRVVEKAQWAIT